MSGMYRLVKGMYRLDKSSQAVAQSKEICRAILEAQPKPIVLKTGSLFAAESAKHFQQAFHLAYCALRCWLLLSLENLSKPLHFFQKVFQRQSKCEDSLPQSDAKTQNPSSSEKQPCKPLKTNENDT